MTLVAQNRQTGSVSNLSSSLAEKCVWSVKNPDLVYCGIPSNNIGPGEPDNWYRGMTHFSDRIWFFNTKLNTSEILAEPESFFNVKIDLIEPRLSPKEDYLIFENKNDLSLWALKMQ